MHDTQAACWRRPYPRVWSLYNSSGATNSFLEGWQDRTSRSSGRSLGRALVRSLGHCCRATRKAIHRLWDDFQRRFSPKVRAGCLTETQRKSWLWNDLVETFPPETRRSPFSYTLSPCVPVVEEIQCCDLSNSSGRGVYLGCYTRTYSYWAPLRTLYLGADNAGPQETQTDYVFRRDVRIYASKMEAAIHVHWSYSCSVEHTLFQLRKQAPGS